MFSAGISISINPEKGYKQYRKILHISSNLDLTESFINFLTILDNFEKNGKKPLRAKGGGGTKPEWFDH